MTVPDTAPGGGGAERGRPRRTPSPAPVPAAPAGAVLAGGAAATAGTGALGAAAWAWRRRAARPGTPWGRARVVCGHGWAVARAQAGIVSGTLAGSDAAARVRDGARRVAADPRTPSRARGAAAALGTVAALAVLRRAARRPR